MTTPINYRGKYDPNETYHALDVVYASPNNVICVRANTGEEISNPQYWAVISRGKDGVAPALTVNVNNKHLLINGKDTGVSVQGPQGNATVTHVLTAGQDLNGLKGNDTFFCPALSLGNAPWGEAKKTAILEVQGYSDKYAVQKITDLSNGDQWERAYNGSWTGWRQTTKWS